MIPTITLPATTQETRWVSVNDLRFFVKELEPKPDSMMHQLVLNELYELCGLTAEPQMDINWPDGVEQ